MRVSLTLGIWSPVTFARRGAAAKRVPSEHSLRYSDRRHHYEINEREYDAACDKAERFGQRHPNSVRINERGWKKHAKDHQQSSDHDRDIADAVELATIDPPRTEQHKYATDD